MKSTLQIILACVAALGLASSATAQGQYAPVANMTAASDIGHAQVIGGADPKPMPPSGTGLVQPQPAEFAEQPNGPWGVIAPYAWVFGMQGTIESRGRGQVIDTSVSDGIDAISDLKGAAMLHLESGYGDVGVIADLMYLKLVPLDRVIRVESEATLFELLGMYRVWGSQCRQAGSSYFDVLAGARYYRFTNGIFVNAPDFTLFERTNSWIDLVVGARAGVQILDCLGVFVRADAGGFGIGHSSKKACNVIAGLEYQCCDCASLVAGYRWLHIDRSSGVGTDSSAMNVTFAGPFAGFALRY